MITDYKLIYEDLKDLDAKLIKKINTLGIYNLYELLYYFPRSYQDRTNIKTIAELKEDDYVVIQGKVISANLQNTRNNKKLFKAKVSDGTGTLDITWFQMAYLKKLISVGEEFVFIGGIKKSFYLQMINPEFKKCVNGKCPLKAELLPIYPLKQNFKQKELIKFMKWGIKKSWKLLEENIPQEILTKYKILSRKEALLSIHFPKSYKELEEAKRRFAIEELLILELGILSSRYNLDSQNKDIYFLEDKRSLVKKFLTNLHFDLTSAQKKVITEIHKELSNGQIVNRLIQGDVGSGKTIVAEIMLLYMVENSYQGALMAPTEILAVQHYLSMHDELHKLGLRVEILTGSIIGKKREKLLGDIKSGLVDILIGTHALIEDNVEFHKLGLIIIDEQHRFGVEQRKKLREKGIYSNLLVMSATPIPRSLALSIYGDLDVSIINQLPPGRKAIKTKWIKDEIEKMKMYDFIKNKIKQGQQAYFVAPLIEESESLNVQSAMEIFQDLSEDVFKGYKLALLHGKMKNNEKDKVMSDFKKGKLQILVSTTVIEVGVNVPNASIMCIIEAQRFGLSALHQLRGRVGRGSHQSYCFLVSNTSNEVSIARLQIMETTNDGFKIAEEDLKLRKAGEIFGTKQSGFSDLQFIDIIHDIKTIKLVRELSIAYLKANKGEISNPYLKKDIEKKFKD